DARQPRPRPKCAGRCRTGQIDSKAMNSRTKTLLEAAEHFNRQRRTAKQRGISWELDFWQWLRIWEESGHLEERGRCRGAIRCVGSRTSALMRPRMSGSTGWKSTPARPRSPSNAFASSAKPPPVQASLNATLALLSASLDLWTSPVSSYHQEPRLISSPRNERAAIRGLRRQSTRRRCPAMDSL